MSKQETGLSWPVVLREIRVALVVAGGAIALLLAAAATFGPGGVR